MDLSGCEIWTMTIKHWTHKTWKHVIINKNNMISLEIKRCKVLCISMKYCNTVLKIGKKTVFNTLMVVLIHMTSDYWLQKNTWQKCDTSVATLHKHLIHTVETLRCHGCRRIDSISWSCCNWEIWTFILMNWRHLRAW